MIEAQVFVSHEALPLSVMEERISVTPSRVWSREQLRSDGLGFHGFNAWMLDLTFPQVVAGGEEGVSAAVEALGEQVALELGSLVQEGCFVSLRMHQTVTLTDDDRQMGLVFSSGCIEWLAKAHAVIDLDQDFYPE